MTVKDDNKFCFGAGDNGPFWMSAEEDNGSGFDITLGVIKHKQL